MGIDTQLIDDGTYFVVESGGVIAGWWLEPSRDAVRWQSDPRAGRQAPRPGDRARPDPRDVHRSCVCPTGCRALRPVAVRRSAEPGIHPNSSSCRPRGRAAHTCRFAPGERLTDATGGAPVPIVDDEGNGSSPTGEAPDDEAPLRAVSVSRSGARSGRCGHGSPARPRCDGARCCPTGFRARCSSCHVSSDVVRSPTSAQWAITTSTTTTIARGEVASNHDGVPVLPSPAVRA